MGGAEGGGASCGEAIRIGLGADSGIDAAADVAKGGALGDGGGVAMGLPTGGGGAR